MDFIIQRDKWRCGGEGSTRVGLGETRLLNIKGFMCCLGQVSQQLGVEPMSLLEIGSPDSLDDPPSLLADLTDDDDEYECHYTQSSLTEKAISLNDNEGITQDEREQQLTALFSEYGHTLTFTGEPVISGANP